MPSAKVNVKTIDKTTAVPSFPGVTAGIVGQFTKGSTTEAVLTTSQLDFRTKYTPDGNITVGMSDEHWSAITYLEKANKLWVMRAIEASYKFGGMIVTQAADDTGATAVVDSANFSFDSTGVLDPATQSFLLATSATGTLQDAATSNYDGITITGVPGIAGNVTVSLLDGSGQTPAVTDGNETVSFASGVISVYIEDGVSTPANIITAILKDPHIATAVLDSSGSPDSVWTLGVGTDSIRLSDLRLTDISINGTAMTSVTGGLVSGMVDGNVALSGGGVTAGDYTIASVTDGNTATLDRSAGTATNATGLILGNRYGDGALFALYAKDPGAWNNDLRIEIVAEHSNVTVAASGANIGTDEINCGTEEFHTGEAVTVKNLGAADNALMDANGYLTNYATLYVVKNSTISAKTQIQLATSQANAAAGTVIDITKTNAATFTIEPFKKVNETGAFIINVYKSSDLVNELESWTCKRGTVNKSAKDGYGANIYIETVLEGSDYVRAVDNEAIAGTVDVTSQAIPLALVGGDDGGTVTSANMVTAANTAFSNQNELAITLLMDGGFADSIYHNGLITIADGRTDCVAIISSRIADEANSNYLNAILDYRNDTLNANTANAAMFTPHPYILDTFNDRNIYIPPDGYAAAAISETAAKQAIWFPAAGPRRGVIVVNDLRRRFSEGEMDILYDNGINPIKYATGKGFRIWGNKTLLSRPTRLQSLHASLLLKVIQPAIAEALEDFLFEINDADTRATVRAMILTYLNGIKANRGITGDPEVICDTSNNVQADFDANRMNVDIYITPPAPIETINFTTIITKETTVTAIAA
jgi:hypothetical protein